MKKLLRLALVLLAALSMNVSFGQTQLTEAVDFTATDTDGNTWNLFDVLAEGKYVLIDFSLLLDLLVLHRYPFSIQPMNILVVEITM